MTKTTELSIHKTKINMVCPSRELPSRGDRMIGACLKPEFGRSARLRKRLGPKSPGARKILHICSARAGWVTIRQQVLLIAGAEAGTYLISSSAMVQYLSPA